MDARFPTHYLNDRRVLRLSPDVFRTFVLATAWAVTNRTDGKIMADELSLVPFATESAATALVVAELWNADSDGWTIADYANTQTSKAQLDGLQERRRNDAERQARVRAKVKAEPSFTQQDHVSESRDDKGKASARKGKERHVVSELTEVETEVVNTATGEVSNPVLSWPVAVIPGSVDDSEAERLREHVAPYVARATADDRPPLTAVNVADIDPGYCEHGMTTGKRCSKCERLRKAS